MEGLIPCGVLAGSLCFCGRAELCRWGWRTLGGIVGDAARKGFPDRTVPGLFRLGLVSDTSQRQITLVGRGSER